MEPNLEAIRDHQKDSWNKFSPGWKKWDDLFMAFLKPMGEEMIRMIKPRDGELVLDVATGTGEPGMTIATMIPNGKVISMDISEGMVGVAREMAKKRRLGNYETRVCDVCELPFPDRMFDAVSCRLGFMFFPDMMMAAREMVRVLKPGGRLVTSVWCAPEENFWITATMGTINSLMQLPSPLPGAPSLFRCSQRGLMHDLFKEAGLKNISEVEVAGRLNCGTTDVYWEMMTEVAAPIVAALNQADDVMRDEIKKAVFQKVDQKFPDGNVNIDARSLVIYGEK